ncbi:MAG: cytochrome c biogenesis heme-transporting ATPase CcmA [Gammaproteobacteria bacterium]
MEAKHLSLERLWTNLSFVLRPGGMLQITGANGAGKSSLLAVLCGLAAPDRGEVSWRRQNIRDAAEDYFSDLIYVGHKNGIKEDMTPLENLRVVAAFRCGAPLFSPERALEKTGLSGVRALCRHLSAGQKRRAALARLLLHRAALWFLDEPRAGLDADGRRVLDDIVAAHLSTGGVAVTATHHPDAVAGAQILRLGRN